MKLKDLEVRRLRLRSPQVIPAKPGHEVYLHALAGSGFASGRRLLKRMDGVWEDPAHGWLYPGEEAITIEPLGALDLVVVSAHVPERKIESSICVVPKRHRIGARHHERTVWEILGAGGPSQRIRFGETYNVRGGWSSWPGHSFDHQPELAPEFEEVFLCFTRPTDGQALIRLNGQYHDGLDVDGSRVIKNGDMFQVPLGEHPIVAYPETELMYVWAYLSPIDKHYGVWAEERGSYA